MKRIIALLLLAALLLCGCDMESTVSNATEKLLRSIAENKELQTWIEEHPLDTLTGDAVDALTKQFPTLEKLTDTDNLKQILKTKGLELMAEYLQSTEPETKEKAETLGAVIKILYPDLADEVDAVLRK